ncbi:MAG: hypothetical protein KF916_02525 [Microbacteriaceae bacterium]|nr:hypothetical protein [Microbacteriaceae bacterium]
MAKHRGVNRILRPDGKLLVVAMDHTNFLDTPVEGLVKYGRTVRESVRAGADAFLAPFGSTEHYADDFGDTAVITSVGLTNPELEVERAALAGADSIKTILFPFQKDDKTVEQAAAVAAWSRRYGLPYLAEPVPGGFSAADMRSPEAIAAGARVSAEIGADIVKTFYTGDPESMKLVVDYASRPVIILGGHAKGSLEEVYGPVHDAVNKAGVAGVAIGTNIWTSSNPGGVVRGLAAILHEGASVEEAVKQANAWKAAE